MAMFSVIVPTYNRENNIISVIESVVLQDYPDWELLIVDDGSTDNTKNVCKEYTKNDRRVKYFYKKNGGVSSARNYGMRNASGDFIIYLDSDNSLREGALRTLAGYISQFPEADLLCYGYTSGKNAWIPESTDKMQLIERNEIRTQYLPTHINLLPQNTNFLQNYVWNKCYRATFLAKNDILFDEKRKTWEDGIFVVNCLDKAENLLLVPDVIYNAYCAQTVDHLSDKLFDTQLKQYILDESEFQQRFGNELDFNNQRYCRSNFNVMMVLFGKAVGTFGKDSIGMISDVLSFSILSFWVDRICAQDKTEQNIIDAIKNKNAKRVYKTYHPNLMIRLIKMIIRRS